jgi:anti-sigma regulatory factor (Ser/Thr protein kinase)
MTNRVKLPAQFESLESVREFVGAQAEVCGLDAKAVYQVQMAVDEAFTNIVEHAYGGQNIENGIECTCQTSEEGLVITLEDCGVPFDPSRVPEPDLTSDLKDRKVGGLGLFFMHKLMDEVSFTFVPGGCGGNGCNILRMVKRKRKAA